MKEVYVLWHLRQFRHYKKLNLMLTLEKIKDKINNDTITCAVKPVYHGHYREMVRWSLNTDWLLCTGFLLLYWKLKWIKHFYVKVIILFTDSKVKTVC